MKMFCGCMSTKSGTMFILGMSILLYITGIAFSSMRLSSDSSIWFQNSIVVPDECQAAGDKKDSWWCSILNDLDTFERDIAVAKLVISVFLLIAAILAVYATTSGKRFLLLPHIVFEFLCLAAYVGILITVVLVLGVYAPGGIDLTTTISVGVLGAIFMVILFYLWLCVVSHYQIVGEIKDMAADKVKVLQFQNEFSEEGDPSMTKYDRFNNSYDPHSDDYPTDDTSPPPEYEPPSDDLAQLEDIDAKVEFENIKI